MTVQIAYGKNSDNTYYVQACCNDEHCGQLCDCKGYAENLTSLEEAKRVAEKLAKLNHTVATDWT